MRVHNNSWGAFGYARYSVKSLDVDRFVFANPDMLIVAAAGNDGSAVARAPGGRTNAGAGFVDWERCRTGHRKEWPDGRGKPRLPARKGA